MKAIPKWLLIPPLVAALVILGPLSMQSAAPAWNWPDLWQMTAALLGLLLLAFVALGAGGLVPRLRQRRQGTLGAKLVTLRQTLRLSARQSVHAIEFEDRILLVGEHERGLVLLETGHVKADLDEIPPQLPVPRLRLPAVPAAKGLGLDDPRTLLRGRV